jgi:hypothetical protein
MIFRRTQAGREALAKGASHLPFACRRILDLLDADTHLAVIRARLPGCQESEVARWLDQLKSHGLVEAHAAGVERDLDFTGSLSLAALASASNR